MNSNELGIKEKEYRIFTAFAVFWLGLGWLGFLLAIFGVFYPPFFAGYLVLGIGGTIYFFIAKKRSRIFSAELISVVLIISAFVFIFSSFTTPTVFSGRDQGSLSEAAIRLAQNHQLKFSSSVSQEFFKIYGPGKALNFPGFNYTQDGKLVTQFPLPYIAWLGIFYSLFSLGGLLLANAVLFFIFAISFYLLARLFLKTLPAFVAILLVLTSFSFFWFFKFTLSENMALALAWFGILQLMLFLKNKDSLSVISLALSFGLLTFTRIEGFAILAMLFLLFLAKKELRGWLAADKLKRIFLPLSLLAAFFVLNFIVDFNFFKSIGKVIFETLGLLPGNETGSLGFKEKFTRPGLYLFGVLLSYGIVQYLIIGGMGIIYFVKKKAWLKLTPFLLVLPVFAYLIESHISSDHPWMLRRYLFAIFPALIFYSVLFLNDWLGETKKKTFYLIGSALLALNLPLFLNYAFFSENKNLLDQTEKISENFSPNDLVLVDRLTAGSGWSMITGPLSFLHGKQAAYFFNPRDLDKMNLDKFNSVYFVIPDNNLDFYAESGLLHRLVPFKDYEIETTALKQETSNKKTPVELPQKLNITVFGKIYLLKK